MNLAGIVLEGEKCSLKSMRVEYLPDLVSFLNDPRIHRYLRIQTPVTYKQQLEYFNQTTVSEQDAIFAVLAKTRGGGQFVGVVGLHEIDSVRKSARSGAVIGDVRFQGYGIGTEARFLQLQHAFEVLGLDIVFGSAIDFNERSKHLLARTGYVFTGREHKSRFAEGCLHDNCLYMVTRERWADAWRAYCKS